MTIAALQLLTQAADRGLRFKVDQGEWVRTVSPTKAWKLVKEVEEAVVIFTTEDGYRVGNALLMAPGPGSCSPEETLVDYSAWPSDADARRVAFTKLCDSIIEFS